MKFSLSFVAALLCASALLCPSVSYAQYSTPVGVLLTNANNWAETQTIALDKFACFGTNGGCLGQMSPGTDQSFLFTGTNTNAWVIAEKADSGFNFAHAQATNPTLFIHSAAQNTTQWLGLAHDGTDAQISTGTGMIILNTTLKTSHIVQIPTVLHTFDTSTNIATIDHNWISQRSGAQFQIGTISTTNYLLLAEGRDADFDFGHAAQTNPTLFIHSATQSTTEFVGISHNVGGAVINNQGSKTLTEAGGAETVAIITTATTQMTGGHLTYTVKAADSAGGPDYVVRSGLLHFGMTNSAGTTTCTSAISVETADGSVATTGGVAKTLTYAITYVTGTNTCTIKFNIDSDITTVTSASITYTLILDGPGTVS